MVHVKKLSEYLQQMSLLSDIHDKFCKRKKKYHKQAITWVFSTNQLIKNDEFFLWIVRLVSINFIHLNVLKVK